MYGLLSVLYVVLVVVNHVTGRVEQLSVLPENLQHTFDVYRSMVTLDQHPGQMIYWSSLQNYICQFVQSRPEMTPSQTRFFSQKVSEFMQPIFNSNSTRVKRQAFSRPRIRQEIRDLSRGQRRRYFNAVNALKNDRRLTPNIYDVLAAFHQGDIITRAHFGPAFPAWHRLYLWLYESFLRLHDPTVTIPYWASVLDNEMEDATSSVIWSDGFFGNGNGVIRSGPFADWGSINPATVFSRNIGVGPLYSYDDVETIVRKDRNWQLLVPTAETDSQFEMLHGGPHVFVAGSMNRLDEAVRDPIFYSHHCFVDFIWERFRDRQRRNRINPETDYPFNASDTRFRPSHSPTSMMGFFPNNETEIDYQNRVGYLNVFFDLVRYVPVPTCPRCGSRYLVCNRNGPVARCASRSRGGRRRGVWMDDLFADELSTPTPTRQRRAVNPISGETTCPRQPFLRDIDTRRTPPTTNWVYIPVTIITKRPPTYSYFKDFSLYGYGLNSQTRLQNSKIQFTQSGTQKGFAKCSMYEDSVGKITILTYGINYDGVTEEVAVVDNRLGISQSYGYALVRAPTTGLSSDAIVGAFDACGRVCRPYCLKGTTSMSKFAGGIRVTSDLPLQYGNSYAEAMLESWRISPESGTPETDGSNIPLKFYCDYSNDWVWTGPVNLIQSYPQPGSSSQRTIASTSAIDPRLSVDQSRTAGTLHSGEAHRTQPAINAYEGRARNGCVLTNTYCRLRVPCSPCQNWEESFCIGSRHSAVCVNGVFELQDVYIGRQV